MMAPKQDDVYLRCEKRKGHPKKHIDVCHHCRWRKSCSVYQNYCQPGLPLKHIDIDKPKAPKAPPEIRHFKTRPVFTPATEQSDKDKYKEALEMAIIELRDLRDRYL